jgi:hypothetical protein
MAGDKKGWRECGSESQVLEMFHHDTRKRQSIGKSHKKHTVKLGTGGSHL